MRNFVKKNFKKGHKILHELFHHRGLKLTFESLVSVYSHYTFSIEKSARKHTYKQIKIEIHQKQITENNENITTENQQNENKRSSVYK